MLEVWVDAQLPPRLARWLTDPGGVRALHVGDLGLLEVDDGMIFERARRAGVVLVTRDQDFLTLLERRGPPPAIVWVTVGNCKNAALLARFEQSWAEVLAMLNSGEALIELA